MGAPVPYQPPQPPLPGHAPSAGVVAGAGETAASSVAARAKAEVEARAIVALNRPRHIETFRLRLLEACRRTRFAETARYSKPVAGSRVEGFSIRFAEEAARHYGNLQVSAQVVWDDEEKRIVKVTAVDLETNLVNDIDVTVQKIVERSRTKPGDEVVRTRQNSKGQTTFVLRAGDDDLLNKQAALVSKARRQLILQLIPTDIQEEAGEIVLATLQHEEDTDPTAVRKRLVDTFYTLGVSPDQLEAFLGHPLAQTNKAELHLLRSIYTGLKDGEATWGDVMEQAGRTTPATPATKGAEGLKARIAKPAAEPTPDPARDREPGEDDA